MITFQEQSIFAVRETGWRRTFERRRIGKGRWSTDIFSIGGSCIRHDGHVPCRDGKRRCAGECIL